MSAAPCIEILHPDLVGEQQNVGVSGRSHKEPGAGVPTIPISFPCPVFLLSCPFRIMVTDQRTGPWGVACFLHGDASHWDTEDLICAGAGLVEMPDRSYLLPGAEKLGNFGSCSSILLDQGLGREEPRRVSMSNAVSERLLWGCLGTGHSASVGFHVKLDPQFQKSRAGGRARGRTCPCHGPGPEFHPLPETAEIATANFMVLCC